MSISHQGKIEFLERNIVRKTIDKQIELNKYSSLENELKFIEIFSNNGKNPYSPKILSTLYEINAYEMEKYKVVLGTTKRILTPNLIRIFFSLSSDELCSQLDEIFKILSEKRIVHNDINPGNLLFCEKDKKLKLIDFYWAHYEGESSNLPPSGVNGIYGKDYDAITKIKTQIDSKWKELANSFNKLKSKTNEFGKKYVDGSAKHVGKSYQKIDIPEFSNIPYHRNTDFEFNEIKSMINYDLKSVTDIGCASGYATFNFIRSYNLDYIISYEADPVVFDFLSEIKGFYGLDELTLKNKIDIDTVFEKTDLIYCMNVHMWLYKQLGDNVDIVMRNMISNCKEMFFQTAGNESQGMFLVKKLDSKETIKKYLENLGSPNVEFIRSTTEHGGFRHLFRVRGKL